MSLIPVEQSSQLSSLPLRFKSRSIHKAGWGRTSMKISVDDDPSQIRTKIDRMCGKIRSVQAPLDLLPLIQAYISRKSVDDQAAAKTIWKPYMDSIITTELKGISSIVNGRVKSVEFNKFVCRLHVFSQSSGRSMASLLSANINRVKSLTRDLGIETSDVNQRAIGGAYGTLGLMELKRSAEIHSSFSDLFDKMAEPSWKKLIRAQQGIGRTCVEDYFNQSNVSHDFFSKLVGSQYISVSESPVILRPKTSSVYSDPSKFLCTSYNVKGDFGRMELRHSEITGERLKRLLCQAKTIDGTLHFRLSCDVGDTCTAYYPLVLLNDAYAKVRESRDIRERPEVVTANSQPIYEEENGGAADESSLPDWLEYTLLENAFSLDLVRAGVAP